MRVEWNGVLCIRRMRMRMRLGQHIVTDGGVFEKPKHMFSEIAWKITQTGEQNEASDCDRQNLGLIGFVHNRCIEPSDNPG